MATLIDLQLSPAHSTWPQLRDVTQAAEEQGFGAVWVFDHLAGRSLGGDSMLECFTWLGALAEATTSIQLGSLVSNVWNRELGTLAVAAASVVAISGRQFHLGLGAGTSPDSRWASEQIAVGARVEPSLEVRHRRVEDFLQLTDQMWASNRDDRFHSFPLPSPTPTRIVGANSVRLSRLAGRSADGINVHWDHPRRSEFLAAAQEEADRAGRPFIRTAWRAFDPDLLDADHAERRAIADAGIDRLILAVLGPTSTAP